MITNIPVTKEELTTQLQESLLSGEEYIPMKVFFLRWSKFFFRAASVSDLVRVSEGLSGNLLLETDGFTYLKLGPEDQSTQAQLIQTDRTLTPIPDLALSR